MSHIYFLRMNDRIKVGFSTDVKGRLNYWRTTLPYEVELLGAIDGTRKLESEIHGRLAEYGVKKEWFRDCATVRAVIDDLLKRGPAAVEMSRPQKKEHLVEMPEYDRPTDHWAKASEDIEAIFQRYNCEKFFIKRLREIEEGLEPGSFVTKWPDWPFTLHRLRWITHLSVVAMSEVAECFDELSAEWEEFSPGVGLQLQALVEKYKNDCAEIADGKYDDRPVPKRERPYRMSTKPRKIENNKKLMAAMNEFLVGAAT
jgi:hypothetical protein